MKKYTTVDEYIADFPKEVQIILQQMRSTIKAVATKDAVETISYGIPTFKLNKKNLVHFGGFKEHVSFFPTSEPTEVFKKQLAAYDVSKGTIRFPLDKPIPYSLIAEITKYRVKKVLSGN
jgi:uncharacterized protein YdhG (YjbR/CyaY superfamily)